MKTSEELTKDWKAGKLEYHKSYWCKNKDSGEITIAICKVDNVLYSAELGGSLNLGYWEVLEPCDYIETKQTKERLADVNKTINELSEKKNWCNARAKNLLAENTKLYTLIKECADELVVFVGLSLGTASSEALEKCGDLLDRVKEVLIKKVAKDVSNQNSQHSESEANKQNIEEELKYRISLAVFEYMNKNGISVEENTPKYIVDEEVLAAPFSEGKIKHYIKENNFTRLQSILYLWAYNNFSVHSPDDLKDNGRPMYRKLARKLSNLLENSYE